MMLMVLLLLLLLLSYTPNIMVAALRLSGRSLSSCVNEGNFYP